MILTIDAGNTNIKLAAYKNNEIVFLARLKTDKNKTDDEYRIVLYDLLSVYQVPHNAITGCIISSVVPALSAVLKAAVQKTIGCRVLNVNSGIKTGLNIKIDNPGSLGSDFVAAAVGAIHKYPLPCLIISLGSATTFSAIDQSKSFLGGSILPGIDISLQALSARTAQLPAIGLDPPENLIGTNTVQCMNSGVIYGNASLIDGMVARYEQEMKQPLTVVATGGRAEYIVPYCGRKIILDSTLILDGLYQIYLRNTKT